jgi:hypothetical protein
VSTIAGIEAVELLASADPALADAVRKRGRKPVVERTAAQPLTINGIEGVIFAAASGGPGTVFRLDSIDQAAALAARHRGQRVVVVVDSSGSIVASAPAAPVNTVAPAITGTLIEGQTLTASTGTWTGSPAPTYTYQWQADTGGNGTFANIGGATNSTYLLTSGEVGDDVRVVVTATNASGAVSANSAETATIAALDTTPAAFSFTDITDATLSTVYESNTITVTGINGTATVTITGGEYSQNGGAYTSSAGTAVVNDTFKVRHTSSGSNSTATNTALTIGGVSDTYTTTTAAAADTTPDAFTFTDITDATVSTLYESNTITVTGITAAANLTITGGEYSINGGAYASSATTVVVNDTVKVRHTSSASNSTATNTVLTIGGVSDTYTTTTAAAGDWWEDAAYDNQSVIADFNNNRYALPAEVELITNGDFNGSATGWTLTNVAYNAGAIEDTIGGANGTAVQSISLVAGNLYIVTYTVVSVSGANVQIQFTGGTAVSGTSRSSPGTYTQYLTALSGNNAVRIQGTSSAALWNVDNVSVKEVNLTASGGVYPKRSATFDEVFAYTAASTTARTYIASGGTMMNDLAVNAPRFTYINTDRQLRLESAATNVFLNSATGVTQSISVTAQAYTLSFYGTGTITLSGVSTAGPLVGTGANNRVSLTLTPTAGSLTLTVSGTTTNVQLEASSFVTDYIPTAGASVTRAIETARFSPLIEAILQRTAASVVVRADLTNTGATDRRYMGGATTVALAFADATATVVGATNATNEVTATIGGAGSNANALGVALGYDGSGRSLTANGGTVGTDANTAGSLTTVYLGRDTTNAAGTYGDGYYDYVAISPERLPDATLIALAVAA